MLTIFILLKFTDYIHVKFIYIVSEFDEMDPLGDISLSDEEFFGGEDLNKT